MSALFDHMAKEHGLTLLESELAEIERLAAPEMEQRWIEANRRCNMLIEQNRAMRDGIAEIIGTYDNHDVSAKEIISALCELQAKLKEAK